MTPAEHKEYYSNLFRVKVLAADFERSHRYMLSKEKFSQQDVDYAFSLANKEREGGVSSAMFEEKENDDDNLISDEEAINDKWINNMDHPNASASGTYQMLIMKSVFGGMKERCDNEYGGGYRIQDILDWITRDVYNYIQTHEKEMKTIIRGLKHTTKDVNEFKLKAGFKDLITRWIFQVFHDDKDRNQIKVMAQAVTDPRGGVMAEVEDIIEDVMNE